MRTNNKQATPVKYSSRFAPIWKGQAIFFGWLKITKNFTSKDDAVAWYERYQQQGFRYRNAIAVVWQGCKIRTPQRFLKDALCGGEEWQLAMQKRAKSQAQCDYIIYSNDYEEGLVWQ